MHWEPDITVHDVTSVVRFLPPCQPTVPLKFLMAVSNITGQDYTKLSGRINKGDVSSFPHKLYFLGLCY